MIYDDDDNMVIWRMIFPLTTMLHDMVSRSGVLFGVLMVDIMTDERRQQQQRDTMMTPEDETIPMIMTITSSSS